MIYFFVIDGAAILVAIIFGAILAGGSVKAISDFLAEWLEEVYPYLIGLLIIGLVIYYVYNFISYMQKMRSFGTEWSVCLKKIFPGMWSENRMVLTWLLNGTLAILSPVAALGSLASNISEMGIGGFVIDILLVFIFLLSIMIISWLFFKALDLAGRCTVRNGKMVLINIGFFIIQGFCYLIIDSCGF